MKLMNVPHIAIIPFVSCNFNCSYCCANKFNGNSLKLWQQKVDDVNLFLQKLDQRMILVSGGEPLLWQYWNRLIEANEHYWYFATNASVIPDFLSWPAVKAKVKLFIAAYHYEEMDADTFIGKVHKLQDMGYAVFAKIIYARQPRQIADFEAISKANIPVSFSPMLGATYSETELRVLKHFCPSQMYYRRFTGEDKRQPGPCTAGMANSTFEIRCTEIFRCGLPDLPIVGDNFNPPKFIKQIVNGDMWSYGVKTLSALTGRKLNLGTIYAPQFHTMPAICHRRTCQCEWHTFGELGADTGENARWQIFIETGKWI